MIIDLYNTIKAHPAYFKQLSCKGMLFTQYDCPQVDAKQDLFSTTSYIAYVLKGKRTFHFPGQIVDMSEGACAFIKKGGWIAEKETGAGWCVMVFFIPDNYLKNFTSSFRLQLPLIGPQSHIELNAIPLDVNATTRNFFLSMVGYFEQEFSPPEELIELKFKELLFNLLINPQNRSFLGWINTIADMHQQPLIDTMEANFTFNLPLKEFARISQRSLAGFKREFLTLFKISPGVWLKNKRLDYASLLLRSSAKRVNDIAFESGFENTTHFSRAFKEKFDMSPLQYRKQQLPLIS